MSKVLILSSSDETGLTSPVIGFSLKHSIEVRTDLAVGAFKICGLLNSIIGLATFVTDPAAALTFRELFVLYLIISLVFDGATPNLSVLNNFEGSKVKSEI